MRASAHAGVYGDRGKEGDGWFGDSSALADPGKQITRRRLSRAQTDP